MDFKGIYTSTRTYIILLIIGVVLLLFTIGMAYRQIVLMQKSADMVMRTLEIHITLGELTSHYDRAESEEFRKDLLENRISKDEFKAYKVEGKALIDSLRLLTQDHELQKLRLNPLANLLDTLHEQLINFNSIDNLNNEETLEMLEWQKSNIAKTIGEIRNLKNRMLEDEERLMLNNKAEYSFHKFLTPSFLFWTAFIALVLFIISFFRIYFGKLRIKKSANFLNSVLANTNNIVNYYEPVFDKFREITDFKIRYANDCNEDYLGLKPIEIVGKSVLEVYPLHNSSTSLFELIQCYQEQTKVTFDREIATDNGNMWFHSIVTPLGNGILVTSRNSTSEEHTKKIELAFKEQLELQNAELRNSRALLTNIFKSIVHVVIHFKSVRDHAGKIIDFEVLFINDRISAFNIDFPEKLKNQRISKIYPDIYNSRVFKQLVRAVERDEPGIYEMPYYNDKKLNWYRYTAIKLGDGVTVTIRDTTQEKERINEITKLNEELLIQNSILKDAERLAKIGSFFWYMDKPYASISDNFYAMLGYEPGGFEASFQRYREFVHPDDLAMYDKNIERLREKLLIKESTYRIISKQGAIKYFKINGQFISKNNKKVMIGVVQDVTQAIEAEAKLLESNLELKNSNSELESFNRVASHDLQEPLRKIQLFSLRIEELDGAKLSDKSKEYFERVIVAVKRMQSLIDNLLAYSRIDSSKKDFEAIDLNQTMHKIKDDLATTIHDTGAEVIVDKLPLVKGVMFQMEQLFTNLVSNALKYRDANRPLKIHVHYEKEYAKNMTGHFVTTVQQYHKISFSDNGIGFESQYAEKIFEVFQRLHQKTEYSGTGIGLAICKKIVDNHNGFIHAKGKIGEGSEFIIYLPVEPVSSELFR